MDSTVLIVGIIVAGILIVVFLLRNRITSLGVKTSSTEGQLNIKAAPPQPTADKILPPDSVNVSDNKFVGDTGVDISRDNTNVSDNVAVGKTKITVSQNDPKTKK